MEADDERIANEENEEESEDEYTYEEEIELDSDSEIDESQSEDLDATLQSLQKLSYMLGKDKLKEGTETTVTRKAEVADDFVRNFLIRMGMKKTVATFETEWFEIRENKQILDSQIGTVPDEYVRAMKKEEILQNLQHQLQQANLLAQYRQEMLEKLRKERNVHRMHHRRIAQEKNRLIVDVKRLRKHYGQYEPIIRELKKKYDTLMRTKCMIALERDRLQALLAASDQGSESSYATASTAKTKTTKESATRAGSMSGQVYRVDPLSIPRPNTAVSQEPTVVKNFVLQKTFKGHLMPISNVVLHPKKPVAVTASDDSSWQMWGLPAGDLIMTGDGHKSWVAGIDFHPNGMQLASSSGDFTVKIWSFEKACCIHTFSDHTQAVWAVSYHDNGEVLGSASMDHTARIWDLAIMKCRGTLRGHVDSVNGCVWQPYSSVLCTASSDKTVSLWDARASLCVQTFYGHQSSCNHAAFDPKGETVVSVDANGIVKIWDIRKVAEYATIDVGPQPANKCAVDKSGYVVAIASCDSTIKCFQTYGEVVPIKELQGHTDAVQAVVFDRQGRYMVSAGSDCTFRIWG